MTLPRGRTQGVSLGLGVQDNMAVLDSSSMVFSLRHAQSTSGTEYRRFSYSAACSSVCGGSSEGRWRKPSSVRSKSFSLLWTM